MKNRSKNETNIGRHLDIDFTSILVGFGSQVGEENPPKRRKIGVQGQILASKKMTKFALKTKIDPSPT